MPNSIVKYTQLKWLWLTVIMIMLDQVTKYWAEHILQDGVVPIFFWFDFQLAHNTGAAFSFLSDAGGWQQVFFFSLAVLVSVALIVMISKLERHERHLAIAYSLIIAGALGNAIDRAVYQYVIDFIHWFYNDWHYPYFNIADTAIFVGAGLLITEALGKPFLNKPDTKNQKRAQE
ncbi:signal peptidase II [Arenicella sp.]|nr:signal peptidase II [Arenicella sp.]